jgi:hypothetical protein
MKRVLVNCIGVHVKNFAVVQNQIALTLKSFVLGITGNAEVSKDVLQKQYNYMTLGEDEQKNIGIPFIKRILSQINLHESVDAIEDRFLPDGDKQFLLMIIESLQQGQRIQVTKIKAAQEQKTQASHAGGDMKIQDKENIKNIFDMFNGQHSK